MAVFAEHSELIMPSLYSSSQLVYRVTVTLQLEMAFKFYKIQHLKFCRLI